MTFYRMTKILDKNAMTFVKSGDLKKAFAAMECAAVIRRMDPKVLRMVVPEDIAET
jgi:hypothetical protein